MPRKCQLTGKKTTFGNNVSHSHRKTRRNWKVNLINKRIYLEDENRWVKLKISTSALRTLNKKGLKQFAKENNIKL